MRRLLARALRRSRRERSVCARRSATPSSAPTGANGWYRSNVTDRWSGRATATSCDIDVPGSPSSSSHGRGDEHATVHDDHFTVGPRSAPLVLWLRSRSTRPRPTARRRALVRGPDANGWYNHPVSIAFSGTDADLRDRLAARAPTTAAATAARRRSVGTCTDVAGNTSAPAEVGFQYDATPPAVTPTPDAHPTTRAWYRKPFSVSFGGSGRHLRDRVLHRARALHRARTARRRPSKGSCRDACRQLGGDDASRSSTTRRAPKLAEAERRHADQGVDHDRVVAGARRRVDADRPLRRARRAPRRARSSTRGKARRFVDKSVQAGQPLSLSAGRRDLAGNISGRIATAGPLAPLYRPAAGAAVRGAAAARAGRTSPARSSTTCSCSGTGSRCSAAGRGGEAPARPRRGSYGGKRQRLVPGSYRWYVWGARGTRERPTYGRVLGSSTFRIRG